MKNPLKYLKPRQKHDADADIDIDTDAISIEKLTQTIYGVRFPWEAIFFVIIGALSEVVDALFMNSSLDTLGGGLTSADNLLVSGIIGAGCFFSMAFAGFQLGNRRYYTKFGIIASYSFWAVAGFGLVSAKILAGLVGGGLDDALMGKIPITEVFATEDFLSNLVIGILQLILYVGTGFITRDSVRILTDNDLREYFLARHKFDKLIKELSHKRGDIVEDISILKAYPKYAARLVRSKQSVQKNIRQYNESARAIIEAKMAITVEPDLMEDMYNKAMAKENQINKTK